MATFADDIADDLAAVVFSTTEFAQTVTYAGAEIPAIFTSGEDLEERSDSVAATAVLLVRVSDVANPTYRDAVVVGSDTWYVRSISGGDGHVWTLALERDERPLW
jgi:hypothetical protein